MALAERLIVVPDFFARAAEMRESFEERLGALRGISRGRFIWDYWHVPNQYTYLRTLAEYVFPPELYKSFLHHLRCWGREHLGCSKILSPWLSYYIDGCGQELHADVPQGPWAYVFSITDWEQRGFTGGETMLLKPECLDFWRRFDPALALEAHSLVELIPPRFNQLTVFDPRIPHGVRPVQGTRDPLRSRVVLHSWFQYPSPTMSDELQGTLSPSVLASAAASLERRLEEFDAVTGLVTARLDLNPNGSVSNVQILSNTLVSTVGQTDRPEAIVQVIKGFLLALKFPPAPDNAWVILPVMLPVGRTAVEAAPGTGV